MQDPASFHLQALIHKAGPTQKSTRAQNYCVNLHTQVPGNLGTYGELDLT